MSDKPVTPLTIAFLGLGVMGAPIATHLARAGHHVVGYNRTAAKALAWQAGLEAEGISSTIALTPAAAASGADVAMTCVGKDDDLEQVVLGTEGALAAMAPGSLLVDHTTVSAGMARTIEQTAIERDVHAIDAPVSGGQAGAESGRLAIMCGGSAEAFARAEPVMRCYGARIVHVGVAGAGQTAKMANQMCIAGILGGLSEAIRLVQASAVDPDKVFQAISGGAAQSWQMDNRWENMVEDRFDFGFAVDWMRKDLTYALGEVRRLGLQAPVTELVDGLYSDVQQLGGARQDTSALIRRLPKGRK